MGSPDGSDFDSTKGLSCSSFMSSGGRNIKSASRAIERVIAVSLAILPFIEKEEKDKKKKVSALKRLKEDNQIQAAIELLKDKEKYNSLLGT